MSIGIYSFLRIYFLGFGASVFAQFRTHCQPSSACRRPDLPGVGGLVSSADRCSVSSVWACVSVRGVVCLAFGTGCPAACAVQSVRVCWGLGSPPAGYTGSAGGWVVDSLRRKNSKKAFSGGCAANTHPTFTNQNPSDCASLQKFQKIQKDPFRSLDCAIIS